MDNLWISLEFVEFGSLVGQEPINTVYLAPYKIDPQLDFLGAMYLSNLNLLLVLVS